MSVAYILEPNTSLHREGDRLVAKKDGRSLQALHLFKLDQLVLFGSVFLTPAALSTLLDRNIDTVFMTASGRYRGRLQPPFSKNISLRRDQFGRLGDERFGLEIARSIVSGKLANARTMLLRLNRSRQELDLDNAVLSLKQLSGRASEAEDMDILRGLEGRAAVLYFEGFSKGFLVEGVTFRRRVRRPPTDPVNALLSLGYTFLFNAVMASVSAVGFDPYLGCLHCVEYGRPSLALDLMEEWRPVLVDSLVLSVFNLGILTLDDFVTVQASEQDVEEAEGADPLEDPMEDDADRTSKPRLPVRLTDSGFRKFITQWERKINERIRFHLTGRQLDYRGCIEEQVRHLARVVRGEEDRYRPMPWK
ncbi:MAG: CRISPR-associated endonuclease Cas1 [Syntrophobacteraceae bacterium]|nr:CRISPR-associated endonuclease Cas1 [Syntrophobacteraceae bacterium]